MQQGVPWSHLQLALASPALDINVDVKVKQKIGAGQLVEFGPLLQNRSTEQFDVAFHANTFSLVPKVKPIFIRTMELWNSPFQIFVTVVVKATPDIAVPLMKYVNTIQ